MFHQPVSLETSPWLRISEAAAETTPPAKRLKRRKKRRPTPTDKIDKWATHRDVPYRLVYSLLSKDATPSVHMWSGTVRRDPADQPVITVADVSCNTHEAFPNTQYTANMAKLNPDLLAFVGD